MVWKDKNTQLELVSVMPRFAGHKGIQVLLFPMKQDAESGGKLLFKYYRQRQKKSKTKDLSNFYMGSDF